MPDAAEGARPLVLRCAWCERIRDHEGVWRTLPVRELRALETGNRLTHGMCDTCFAEQTRIANAAQFGRRAHG